MRAIVQRGYGSPDQVLELADVAVPEPAADEVLVRIHAASVHPDVWHVVRGFPLVLRLMGAGVRRPRVAVPGTDMAGIVERVGRSVTQHSPGDAVYGETLRGHQWKNGGAFAEYATVHESALAPKPADLSFAEAAAIPTSAYIAYDNMGHLVDDGMRVAVNGAAGGVGMFCVQIAKAAGAHVTGVDSGAKLDMMRRIGADEVVDYAAEDFTADPDGFDLIVDIPGNRSFDDLARVLRPGGSYVYIGHDRFAKRRHRVLGSTIPRMLRLGLEAPFGRGRQSARKDRPDHRVATRALVAAGAIRPVLEETPFGLAEVASALKYLEEGRALGKIVVRVADEAPGSSPH